MKNKILPLLMATCSFMAFQSDILASTDDLKQTFVWQSTSIDICDVEELLPMIKDFPDATKCALDKGLNPEVIAAVHPLMSSEWMKENVPFIQGCDVFFDELKNVTVEQMQMLVNPILKELSQRKIDSRRWPLFIEKIQVLIKLPSLQHMEVTIKALEDLLRLIHSRELNWYNVETKLTDMLDTCYRANNFKEISEDLLKGKKLENALNR